MYDITHVKVPMCEWENCSQTAEYEFTDAVLADKDKPIKDRKIKTVVIYRTCYNHVTDYNDKLKGESK